MLFKETIISGVYIIELEKKYDERGFFARTWCKNEFKEQGLESELAQCNLSYNKKCGTLRGMHYQIAPYGETKLVSCISGAIYDVIIDLRKESPTYEKWYSVELTAENGLMLYIPKGIAHGFQTLKDKTSVFYQMSEFYHPESARGIRWDDVKFNIKWPIAEKIISEKDQSY